MQQRFRTSIDTFYCGLQVDKDMTCEFAEIITDYLKVNYGWSFVEAKCKSPYYLYSEQSVNDDDGFLICFKPRPNCLNDEITLQLSGSFFKDISVSQSFLKFLFDNFSYVINIQRVDVAIDVIYDNYPVDLESSTNCCGFPIPHYSEIYKGKKIPFNFCSRSGNTLHDVQFTYMIYQGKSDVRLRVYDKTLDTIEKHDTYYSDYYNLESSECEQVYRIELQCRGGRLKGFISDLFIDRSAGINKVKKITYDEIISAIVKYIFYKYSFDFINVTSLDSDIKFRELKTSSKLENIIKYHKNQMNSHYKKIIDATEKLIAFRKIEVEKAKIINSISEIQKVADSQELDFYDIYEKISQVNSFTSPVICSDRV